MHSLCQWIIFGDVFLLVEIRELQIELTLNLDGAHGHFDPLHRCSLLLSAEHGAHKGLLFNDSFLDQLFIIIHEFKYIIGTKACL